MRKPAVLILAMLFCITAYSQGDKKLTAQDELLVTLDIFDNKDEQNLITKENFSQSELFELYLNIGSKWTTEPPYKKIETFIAEKGLAGKSFNSKALKKLYKDIHQNFLLQYVDNPKFNEIFINGNYNCATASALFGLILNKIGVNYNIRETPTHVYIVADPGASNILFETTTPGMKTLQLNDKFKSQFLEYLVKNKMISSADAQGPNRDALFEKHFYDDEKIDAKQLAGLLYYNLAIDAMIGEDLLKAYKNFEKAHLLYPSKRIEYLTSLTLLSAIYQKFEEKSQNPWAYYVRYAQLNQEPAGVDLVKGFWGDALQKNYFESPDPAKVTQMYEGMLFYLKDTTMLNEIRYQYYYRTAHYLSIKDKHDSALVFLDSAYRLNSQNLLLQDLISDVVRGTIPSSTYTDTATISLFDRYFKQFPFLDKNGKLGEYYFYALSFVVASFFDEDNKAMGDRYLSVLNQMIELYPATAKKTESYCTVAFIELYHYYIKHRQYKEAKSFLQNTALKYFPQSSELKRRVTSVDNILANN